MIGDRYAKALFITAKTKEQRLTYENILMELDRLLKTTPRVRSFFFKSPNQ